MATISKISLNGTVYDLPSGGGGSSTDVRINNTSITSSGIANIVTESAYDATNNKIATMADISGGDTLPIGTILSFSGSTIPTNYLLADGSAVSRTTYSELFDVIGTTYGAGDGSTTFNLPDLSGKVAVGKDTNDNDFDTLGETGGEKTHTLITSEIPSHSHKLPISGTAGSDDYLISSYTTANRVELGATSSIGGDQAHNNLQPYIVQNYIIKAKMSASLSGQVVDTYSQSTTDAYSCSYVNSIAGGGSTDVQINGTSIVSSDVANIATEGTYNATTNKIATMSDVSALVTASTTDISEGDPLATGTLYVVYE